MPETTLIIGTVAIIVILTIAALVHILYRRRLEVLVSLHAMQQGLIERLDTLPLLITTIEEHDVCKEKDLLLAERHTILSTADVEKALESEAALLDKIATLFDTKYSALESDIDFLELHAGFLTFSQKRAKDIDALNQNIFHFRATRNAIHHMISKVFIADTLPKKTLS